jgi:hypothetical protein
MNIAWWHRFSAPTTRIIAKYGLPDAALYADPAVPGNDPHRSGPLVYTYPL